MEERATSFRFVHLMLKGDYPGEIVLLPPDCNDLHGLPEVVFGLLHVLRRPTYDEAKIEGRYATLLDAFRAHFLALDQEASAEGHPGLFDQCLGPELPFDECLDQLPVLAVADRYVVPPTKGRKKKPLPRDGDAGWTLAEDHAVLGIVAAEKACDTLASRGEDGRGAALEHVVDALRALRWAEYSGGLKATTFEDLERIKNYKERRTSRLLSDASKRRESQKFRKVVHARVDEIRLTDKTSTAHVLGFGILFREYKEGAGAFEPYMGVLYGAVGGDGDQRTLAQWALESDREREGLVAPKRRRKPEGSEKGKKSPA